MANIQKKQPEHMGLTHLVADNAATQRKATVTICEMMGAHITQYAFFDSQNMAFKRALTSQFKLALPAPSCFVKGDAKQLALRVEPTKIWIVSAKKAEKHASVFDKFYPLDLTGSRAVVKIAGGSAVELLRRLTSANLTCDVGSLMATGMHHIPVHLLKLADDAFLLFIPRSYAESLGHLIVQISRQFGSAVKPPETFK